MLEQMLEARRPIVICAEHGLCNRLRAVLSYRLMALAQGRELLVVWRIDDACNGLFLDCFSPLPGVSFVEVAPMWDPEPELANETHPDVGPSAEVDGYRLLVPTAAIKAEVARRVRGLAPPYASVHIRRTDFSTFFGPEFAVRGQTTDGAFQDFLDHERRVGLNVFIATDCEETSQRFRARYDARLGAEPSAAHTFSHDALRQTSLHDAVVDLFMCASSECECFMGSRGSSFSDTVRHLRSAARAAAG